MSWELNVVRDISQPSPLFLIATISATFNFFEKNFSIFSNTFDFSLSYSVDIFLSCGNILRCFC